MKIIIIMKIEHSLKLLMNKAMKTIKTKINQPKKYHDKLKVLPQTKIKQLLKSYSQYISILKYITLF